MIYDKAQILIEALAFSRLAPSTGLTTNKESI